MMDRKAFIQKVIVFCVGIIMAVVFLEVSLRAIGFIWKFRQTQYQRSSAEGDLTILCVGNCFTAGVGAPAGKSYPAQLQEIFDQEYQNHNITVINEGKPGQNSGELADRTAELISLFSPDILLVQTGSANLANPSGSGRVISAEGQSKNLSQQRAAQKRQSSIARKLFYGSSIHRLFRMIKREIQIKREGKKGVGSFDRTTLEAVNERKVEGRNEEARRMLDLVRKLPDSPEKRELADWFMRFLRFGGAGTPRTATRSYIANARRSGYLSRENTSEILDGVESDINRIVTIANKNGVKVVLLNYPVRSQISRSFGGSVRTSGTVRVASLARGKGSTSRDLSGRSGLDPRIQLGRSLPEAFILSVNSLIRDYSNRENISFVDVEKEFTESVDSDEGFFGSGRHPNAEGYNVVARVVYKGLLENRVIPAPR
jgi:lysophospholipase L1-like esterase